MIILLLNILLIQKPIAIIKYFYIYVYICLKAKSLFYFYSPPAISNILMLFSHLIREFSIFKKSFEKLFDIYLLLK